MISVLNLITRPMNLPASPQTIIRFIAAIVAILIARTAWKRRDIPGSLPFTGLMLAAGWWALFSSLEYASQDISLRILWSKFEYFGITTIPPCWFLFAVGYSQKNYLSGRRIEIPPAYLFLIPAIAVLLTWTNEYHHLIWTSVEPVVTSNGIDFQFNHGIAFWVFWIYSYTLLLAGTLVLFMVSARFPALYRKQAIAILVGAAFPWLANLAYVLRLPPFATSDPTPVAFVLAGVVFAVSVFRFYLFDIVPVAQDAVIESITDGIVVLDARKRIVYTNPAMRQIVPSGDWTGRSIVQAFGAYPDLVLILQHPTPEPVEIRIESLDVRVIEIKTSKVLGPRGELNGSVITIRDITERKAIEEQQRLQSLALESAANGIVITDRRGKIQWINPAFAKITGYESTEVIGEKISILKSGRQADEYYTDLWQTIASGQVWSGELINRRKDGSIYTEEQTISPVRDTLTGEVTHYIGVKQDITTRKNLEQMRDDLMKSLVHDLRNPLNSIMLTLDIFRVLPEQIVLPEAVEVMFQMARESAIRMNTMVNAILDISRLESGQMPIQRQAVILADVVEMAFSQQATLASRSEILLLNGVSYDLPPVQADPGLLNRVMQNLLDNALKFTPNGGTVEVSAIFDPEKDEIRLEVKDSGPGIPEYLLSRVFEKYASSDTNGRGTGLGLAFCKLAVEAHGGEIWVESYPGQGTTICFSIPAGLAENKTRERQKPHQ
jgi:PAS domain S-box-containing protein